MKSLFLHGLSRNGTTMLESIIDSQDRMACFWYLFRLAEVHRACRADPDPPGPTGASVERRRFENVKQALLSQYIDFIGTVSGNNSFIEDDMEIGLDTRVSGVPMSKIIEGIRFIALAKTMADLLDIEQRLGQFFGLDVLAYRAGRTYSVAPRHMRQDGSYWVEMARWWLEKRNSYWIEVVRNPYDRLTSAMLMAPEAKFTEMLEETNAHFRFVSEMTHPRFLVIKYEDLCAEPDRELARISAFLGEPVVNRPLVNYYGRPFYPNTSENVLAGKFYMHQDSKYPSRIGGMKDGRWNDRITPAFAALVNARVDTRGLYEKMAVPAVIQLKGALKLARLDARERLRDAVVAGFRAIGLNVTRMR